MTKGKATPANKKPRLPTQSAWARGPPQNQPSLSSSQKAEKQPIQDLTPAPSILNPAPKVLPASTVEVIAQPLHTAAPTDSTASATGRPKAYASKSERQTIKLSAKSAWSKGPPISQKPSAAAATVQTKTIPVAASNRTRKTIGTVQQDLEKHTRSKPALKSSFQKTSPDTFFDSPAQATQVQPVDAARHPRSQPQSEPALTAQLPIKSAWAKGPPQITIAQAPKSSSSKIQSSNSNHSLPKSAEPSPIDPESVNHSIVSFSSIASHTRSSSLSKPAKLEILKMFQSTQGESSVPPDNLPNSSQNSTTQLEGAANQSPSWYSPIPVIPGALNASHEVTSPNPTTFPSHNTPSKVDIRKLFQSTPSPANTSSSSSRNSLPSFSSFSHSSASPESPATPFHSSENLPSSAIEHRAQSLGEDPERPSPRVVPPFPANARLLSSLARAGFYDYYPSSSNTPGSRTSIVSPIPSNVDSSIPSRPNVIASAGDFSFHESSDRAISPPSDFYSDYQPLSLRSARPLLSYPNGSSSTRNPIAEEYTDHPGFYSNYRPPLSLTSAGSRTSIGSPITLNLDSPAPSNPNGTDSARGASQSEFLDRAASSPSGAFYSKYRFPDPESLGSAGSRTSVISPLPLNLDSSAPSRSNVTSSANGLGFNADGDPTLPKYELVPNTSERPSRSYYDQSQAPQRPYSMLPPSSWSATLPNVREERLSATLVELENVNSRLQKAFKDEAEYKLLLSVRGLQAHSLLDTFQTLLDSCRPEGETRRNLIVATRRLSTKTDLYPRSFDLNGVQLTSQSPLASGSFADIHMGRLLGENVCLKVIRVYQSSVYQHIVKTTAREVILWGQLSHPNLLPFYGLHRLGSQLALVCPWADNGRVVDFLKKYPDTDRVLLVSDTVEGLAYLHANDVIHGDLKGANVLVDGVGRACLADFGLSAVTDPLILQWTSHSSAASRGGTVRWQAPELNVPETIEGESSEAGTVPLAIHNTTATDIYALSCVFYEILTGRLPFFEYGRDHTVMVNVGAGIRPSRPATLVEQWKELGMSDSMWDLMTECWRHEPTQRPSIDEVLLRLSFIKPIDTRPPSNWIDTAVRFRGSAHAPHRPLTLEELETILTPPRPLT